MKEYIFLFPGQGSQFVGMGRDLPAQWPQAAELFARADTILGYQLSEIAFNGPEEKLRQTQYTQPAIFIHSLAVQQVLAEHCIHPVATAGHSLGEFSALVAAGGLAFDEALEVGALRGKLLQEAGTIAPGTMAAIIGLDGQRVEELCAKHNGVVVPANYNCPGQLVVSGEVAAVHSIMPVMREAGAKIVKELTVSGAFHSPLMSEAVSGLETALKQANIITTSVPIWQNVDANASLSGEEVRAKLLAQLTSPVRWEATIRNMLSEGHNAFLELGPGNVLKGLCKRIDRTASCQAIGTHGEIEALLNSVES
jgi:[acyl-carrier-protein] S-malonyltransferase